MLGAAASRHHRRKSISPCVTPAPSPRPSITPAAADEIAAAVRSKDPNHLSIPDLPPGAQLNRRRAANIGDQKTCALLHAKLKGLEIDEKS